DQEVGAMQDLLLETAAHFSDPNDATLSYSAALPPGLAIESDSGRISGRPERLGEHAIAVRATNADAEFITAYFTLTVLPEAFAGGHGSSEDPWQVATPGQLFALRGDLLAHYRLVADIDLDTAPWNEGAGWLPIGDAGASFL